MTRALVASGLAALSLGGAFGSARASAQERRLEAFDDVAEACRSADEEGLHERLYSVVIDGRASLRRRAGREDGEFRYGLSDVRLLRAFDGAVQLIPARLERLAFLANEERARTLDVALARGARLRVGFFLGLDEPDRRACILRVRQAVTTLRVDLAFIELLDAEGAVIAREDHERLRAWSDDPFRGVVREPEVHVGEPTLSGSPAPASWTAAIRAEAVRGRLLRCHVEGLERGAAREASAQVLLRVEAQSGRVSDAVLEVGNVGDEPENACLLEVLGALELPPLPSGSGRVVLRVPLRLRAP